MSFSNEVKAELISAVTDKDKKYACLYGLIIFCNKITDDEICFQSESAEVADVFVSLMNEIFKGSVTISKDVIERKNGTSLHSFVISDSESVRRVTETFKIDAEKREIDLKNIDNNSLSNYII